MSELLVFYTILVIIFVSICYLAYKYTIQSKKLGAKEWLLITSGMFVLTISDQLIMSAIEINDRMAIDIKVPKEIYSQIEYEEDSVLTDQMLYNYLLDMRAKHPKIILCQAKIESANYKSVLFKRQHNIFGMKVPMVRTTAGYGGKAGYQNYNNWRESAIDYIFWQHSNGADKLKQDDYLAYLGKVYAEDPEYVNKIKKMMVEIDFKKLKY